MTAEIILLIITAFGVLMAWIGLICQKEGYKLGQIDAINGITKYHLIEFSDGSREWRNENNLKTLDKNKIKYKVVTPNSNYNPR